jgi:sulfide:quinone oxidoreductase
MNRVLTLGGGFGGIAAAHTLRRLLQPEDEIVLVDRRPHFMVGFRKTWVMLDMAPEDEGQGVLADLESAGIRVVRGAIEAIDPAARSAKVGQEWLAADALIVALGARLAPERIPGFAEHAVSIYDPEVMDRNRAAMRAFGGGRAAVGVFGLPYKCPPAPYEIALLVAAYFEGRGVAAEVEVFTPQPAAMPILADGGASIVERMAGRGITFLPNRVAQAVEPGAVLFAAERRPYDLILGVAPHAVPAVVAASGLTGEAPWIPVDPRTLETAFADVYAIGDVTAIAMADGKPLPKAGIFAEAEGRVVAQRIADRLAGRAPTAQFDARGGCFLEVGGGQAMMIEGDFLAPGAPQVALKGPSEAYMQEKLAFERDRLAEWFGPSD